MAKLGLSFDAEPGAGFFHFPNPAADYRFYLTSLPPPRLFSLLQSVLDLLKPRTHFHLCKRGFSPWGRSNPAYTWRSLDAHEHVLRALGIPLGGRGALRFSMGQSHEGLALLYHLAMVCTGPDDDVHLIPDHGRCFATLNHHDVIFIEFANRRSAGPFVRRMAKAGFELPTKIPDETFYVPKWMKPKPHAD
ncbi:MAG: hypothetical protein NTW19_20500 [Planctomycetota bacterium]|nr:hypothetical protein [Planctomycetota bacterium]